MGALVVVDLVSIWRVLMWLVCLCVLAILDAALLAWVARRYP